MKIVKKLFVVILILAVIGGGVYYFFVRATGFSSKGDLVNGFIENIKQDDVCDEYFTKDSNSICLDFVAAVGENQLIVKSVTPSSDGATVVLINGENQSAFTFHMSTTKNNGLKAIFNKEYYLIDYIE